MEGCDLPFVSTEQQCMGPFASAHGDGSAPTAHGEGVALGEDEDHEFGAPLGEDDAIGAEDGLQSAVNCSTL